MVYALAQYLSQGKRVGIVIARRQVVLELTERFRKIFDNLVITPVCEGHTDILSGHLIISTSHQLFRYHKHFDVLFVDEPDAFPFSSDFVLQGFAKQAVVGNTIYLSATPNDWVLKSVAKTLTLNRRPHGYDLPVPKLILSPLIFQIIYLLNYVSKTQKPILVFVPSIRLGKQLSLMLRIPFVYSGSQALETHIEHFRAHQTHVLLTTTLLERGVTFYGVQVLILEANHSVFSLSTLIQIAGRVGRDPKDPSGDVIFLCSKKSKILTQAIQDIQSANCA
jgi:competence protein ComFA